MSPSQTIIAIGTGIPFNKKRNNVSQFKASQKLKRKITNFKYFVGKDIFFLRKRVNRVCNSKYTNDKIW